MSEMILTLDRSRRVYRIAIGSLFFMLGLTFATWASRIPSIQQQMQLSDTALGLVLLAIPLGSLLSIPFTGTLVNRFGSRKIASNALMFYSLLLILLGYANTLPSLLAVLVLFGAAGNTANIAINTQAVNIEAFYGRSIMASFHGLWSLAGFAAAGIGTYMIGENVLPLNHFLLISSLIIAAIAISFRFLLPDVKAADSSSSKFFVKPDKQLLLLGVIGFCCMICEGAMFDWSGIYFQRIVGAEKGMIGAGYTAFMCTMAGGRFVADWVSHRLGFKRTVQYSGLLIALGLGIAVVFPYLPAAITGFLLVGLGVSSVVPLVYSEAGKTNPSSPSLALAAVSSISFFGFLIGPPLIGLVAGAFGLQASFAIIALMGLSIIVIVKTKKT